MAQRLVGLHYNQECRNRSHYGVYSEAEAKAQDNLGDSVKPRTSSPNRDHIAKNDDKVIPGCGPDYDALFSSNVPGITSRNESASSIRLALRLSLRASSCGLRLMPSTPRSLLVSARANAPSHGSLHHRKSVFYKRLRAITNISKQPARSSRFTRNHQKRPLSRPRSAKSLRPSTSRSLGSSGKSGSISTTILIFGAGAIS